MNHFTSTCAKSYDRHTYKITFQNGREQLFGDYEAMKNFWFMHSKISSMVVSVVDPETVGGGFM